jgi:hypothetical protein
MKRQIFTDAEYRGFIASLTGGIEAKNMSITNAARLLGVTRQALHLHLRDEPKHQLRWRTVGRAVREFDLVIYAQGKRFDKGAFAPERRRSDPAVQLLLLPEAIERLGDANLEVSVARRDATSVLLEVLVKFAG